MRTFLTVRLHAGDRLADVSTRTKVVVDEASRRLTRPEALSGLTLLAVLLFGARSLISGHVPAIGTFGRWPGLDGLLSAYWDPWRQSGLGTDAAAPPVLAAMSALGTALLGATSSARTVVVAGALPFGAVAAYRMVRRLSPSAWPAVAAAAAYSANPLPRNAIARGRLGPLVLFALAPILFGAIVQFVGERGAGGLGSSPIGKRRALLSTALITATATAVWPPAIVFAPAVAVALVLAVPLVGGARIALRGLGIAVAGSALAFVLLAPWSFDVLGGDPATIGLVPRSPLGLADVLGFRTGPAGAGWATWGLYLAAALPLLVATGARLAWAGRAWLMVAVSVALAWLPARLDPTSPVPAHDGLLVGAALGLALAVGLGVAAIVDDLRQFLFGWRQVAAVIAAFGLCLPLLGLLPDTFGGRYRMPQRDWEQALGWMEQERRDGSFRVLWLGAPDVLPLDSRSTAGIGYGITFSGVGDVTALQPSEGAADPVVEEVLRLLAEGRTARAGHLIAPMGIRYVALVSRAGPGSGARASTDQRFAQALGGQLDLAELESERGMLLYENQVWAATRSMVPDGRSDRVPIDSDDPVADAARTRIDLAEPIGGALGESNPTGPGLMLWSQEYDERWSAEAGGRKLEHVRTFGWANGFIVPERAAIDLSYDRGLLRPAMLAGQAAAWAIACVALWRARRDEAAEAASDGDPDVGSSP
ncbi:MAG: hypothetical protein M5T61_01780 [Acidimicrobiia bacterium]|nr:hypothetical protein [Acidimicrobiia bacterium]